MFHVLEEEKISMVVICDASDIIEYDRITIDLIQHSTNIEKKTHPLKINFIITFSFCSCFISEFL